MRRGDSAPAQVSQQVDFLIAYAATYGLSLENVLIARRGGTDVAACLAVDSPGRIATLFLPADSSAPDLVEALRLLLAEAAREGRARGLEILQCMVEADNGVETRALGGAGFIRAARLLYLERDLDAPLPSPRTDESLTFEHYSDDTRKKFEEVLQETYRDSLDCPALNGRRSVEDIMASHRGAGRFDPHTWLLARQGDVPVGLVLVNCFPEQLASEVVYMGVTPSARGRGCGSAILRRAIGAARDQGSTALRLSVDEMNGVARRLYERFGFTEMARRDAWVILLNTAR